MQDKLAETVVNLLGTEKEGYRGAPVIILCMPVLTSQWQLLQPVLGWLAAADQVPSVATEQQHETE